MPERRIRRAAAALAAVLLVAAVLLLPSRPGAPAVALPLELPAILLLLLAAPPALRRPLAWLTTLLLATLTVLKLADIGFETAYLRPFNPVLDAGLLRSAWELGQGSLGTPLAVAAVAALAAAVALLVAALRWATGRIAGLAPGRRPALAAGAAAAVALAATAAVTPLPLANADTARLAWQHAADAGRARADLAQFRADAAADPWAGRPPADILPALRGTDIVLVFVESYGRSAIANPLYAPTVTAALAAGEAELTTAGLAARSGWLTAPMVGGQSWLAHTSVLSGLRIGDQGRYRALLASPRRSLLSLAREAGWQTAAVMPAITRAWPEAAWFGYDRILAAADLGYRGLPFNWVTMPDQFTLASLDRQLLAPAPRAPFFVETALISSHAPWTPIPPIVPWDQLGDGRIFDPYATAGDPPDVVWRDPDRVRDQYRQSLDYVLRTVAAFAARTPRPTLFIVLGDHQPAAFVSGDPANRDVPIHLIGPPSVLAHLDPWGYTPGLIPAADAPVWPMEAFRDRFLTAFGGAAPPMHAAR
ncbi:MAG: sulfatase-like hydrolase/transferase [Amaricoccus sp.]